MSSTLPDLKDTPSHGFDAIDEETGDDGAPITLHTFGAARVMVGDHALGMHNALLFMLVLRMAYAPGMAVRRELLLGEFWPDQEDARQRGNLRQALYKLRSMGVRTALRGDVVQLDEAQVQRTFALAPSVEAFDRHITRGSEPYGSFLPGITPPTPGLTVWVEHTREAMHGAVRRVLVEVLRQRRERADWKGAQMIAQWLLQLDPLNEDATLALAECAALAGSKAEAVAILDRYLAELGPSAGDIRLPATLLRRRFAEPPQRRRSVALMTAKYFFGREEELAECTMSLRRARWHDGSAVLVYGPPGMGKSRLVAEMVKVAQLEGYRDVVVECRESLNGRPLGALIEALPELLSAPGSIGCAPESLAVLRKLLGPESGEAATAVDEAEAEPVGELSPAERIDRALRSMRAQSIRHAVVDLFAAVSDERPIFLLVEDVQWLDDPSWEVLSDVIQRVNEMRVYVILTSRFASVREERPARLPTPLTYRKLPPLGEAALQTLVRSAADDDGVVVPEPVERWIIGGCEGNPLMLRALLEHWAATGNAEGVPPSLTTLIDQRIDRLDAHAQQALSAIILLGQFASLERIKLVLELPVHELIHALEQLELSGCLSTSHASLVITHELVRWVALRRMSPLVETALRAAISDTLETEYTKTSDLVILHEALVHTEHSGRPEVLLRFLNKHNEGLIEGGRPNGVLSSIKTLALSMPHILEDRQFEIIQARLNTQAGEYRRAVRNYLGALQLPGDLRALGIPEIEEQIAIVDSAHRADPVIDRNQLTRFAGAIASNTQLPVTTRIRAAEVGLVIAANTCDAPIAQQCYTAIQSELSAPELEDASQRIELLFNAIFGDLAVAERIAKETIKRAERRPSSTVVAGDLSRAAFALRLCGDVDGAIQAFKKHFEMAEKLNAPRLGLYSAWQIAQIDLERGDNASVTIWNRKLAIILAETNDPISTSFVTAHYCRCAIEERNKAVASRLLAEVKASQPKLPPAKASAYVIALELGCELLNTKWAPHDSLIEAAVLKHAQTSAFGTTDFLTAVLAESMHRAGYTQRGRELIDDYIENARRERSALSRALNAAAKKVRSA